MDFQSSLALLAPEIVLSLSGLALLLLAAWSRNSGRLVSILAAVALGAGAFLVAPALCSGAMGPDTMAFGGQFAADAFASFAKILIFLAAIGCLMVAPRFFDRDGALRASSWPPSTCCGWCAACSSATWRKSASR